MVIVAGKQQQEAIVGLDTPRAGVLWRWGYEESKRPCAVWRYTCEATKKVSPQVKLIIPNNFFQAGTQGIKFFFLEGFRDSIILL